MNAIVYTSNTGTTARYAQLLSQETGMPVHVAERPLDCVADGTGKRLDVNLPNNYYKARRK